MCAQKIAGPLTWLGGGQWAELGERHERSTHAVAGAVVLLGALLAWLAAGVAVSEAARWPMLAVVPLTLVFGLLVGAVARGTAGGTGGPRAGVAGRAAVAVAVGAVVGELAALVIFAGSIDHRLAERAMRDADASPAAAALQQAKDARAGLDRAVERAREHQDQALVVARCEYHPTPACPQTRITGVPGPGPETRTANELLADAQRELDTALAARDTQAPQLDASVSREELALTQARQNAVADAGRGLGARWVAMNEMTLESPGAMALRAVTVAFFALLCVLPLILRRWRGETTHDRHATARAEQERAELEADTAIAVKRAQVRREAEMMWAEHQLTQARLAIEAQTEIDRENQRRRVMEALDAPVRTPSRRAFEPADDDIYLPIAAEAEAASRAIAPLPPAEPAPANLPAPAEPRGEVEPRQERATPLIPSIPDATKAAARWIRPLVPPFVARVIDNTTAPLRTARHVFEEVEEIRFSLKRTHRVTFDAESTEGSRHAPHQAQTSSATRIASSRDEPGAASHERYSAVRSAAAREGAALGTAEGDRNAELAQRDGPHELRSPDGPRQLPPGK